MNIVHVPVCTIEKMLIKYNYTKGDKRKIEFIVIHDTGNPTRGANALKHYQYFNATNRNASAHLFC